MVLLFCWSLFPSCYEKTSSPYKNYPASELRLEQPESPRCFMHTQEHVYSTTSTIFFLSSLGPSHDICSNGLHCSEMSHFFFFTRFSSSFTIYHYLFLESSKCGSQNGFCKKWLLNFFPIRNPVSVLSVINISRF